MKRTISSISVALFVAACSSMPIWKDTTPVRVEAIVRGYAPDTMHMDFADGSYSSTQLFVADLDIISPMPKFEHSLRVSSLRELEENNPLTHVGARVTFVIPRMYLVNVLSDPTKLHDFPFLYFDSVKELREVPKAPNQLPEPTSRLAPGRGSS